MKRWLGILLSLLLLGLAASPALAHSANQIAAVTVKGNQVSIQMADAYGAPVAQAPVGAAATAPGKQPDNYISMKEGPPGTYTGAIAPPAGDIFQLHLQAMLAGEPFRGALQVRNGEDVAELLIPLATLDGEESGFGGWSLYLYIAALIVIVTATAMALLRKRSQGEGAK